MNMENTPRTDALPRIRQAGETEYVPIDDCRQLECELAEAREQVARHNRSFDGHVYVTNEEYSELCEVKRQRDTAQKALFSTTEDYEKVVEQRDELADAANKYTIEHAKRGAVSTATIERLEKALAAVKGGGA
jgi:hypothetical protein